MLEVVKLAGGWLYDQVMAGWDVTVIVAEDADPRPLRILGARTLNFELALANARSPRPQAIAVTAGFFEADDRVRAGVLETLDENRSEVTLWGDQCPSGLEHRFGSAEYQLSVAARAFKAQALVAASARVDRVDPIERFRSGGPTPAGDRPRLASVR